MGFLVQEVLSTGCHRLGLLLQEGLGPRACPVWLGLLLQEGLGPVACPVWLGLLLLLSTASGSRDQFSLLEAKSEFFEQ